MGRRGANRPNPRQPDPGRWKHCDNCGTYYKGSHTCPTPPPPEPK